jgi:hypothetical protein
LLPGRTLLSLSARRAIGTARFSTAAEPEKGVRDTLKGCQVLIIFLGVIIIIILIAIR